MQPSEWNRQSQSGGMEILDPSLVEAIRAHAEQYDYADLMQDLQHCWQTVSHKKQISLFQRLFKTQNRSITNGLALGRRWLVWVANGDKMGVAVLSAKLNSVQLTRYKPTLIDDNGVELQANWTDTSRRGMIFMPLAPGMDPRAVLDAAAANAE